MTDFLRQRPCSSLTNYFHQEEVQIMDSWVSVAHTMTEPGTPNKLQWCPHCGKMITETHLPVCGNRSERED
ncbi:hypothetical protein NPIL_136911 [Nephila pilipes]|uniref:Uncharacterized protein n=1 Tax=Nephila pilipes TaxID=299642 RepID=A0A8X6NJ38_NEPPI|nr:hypothetical protein NPIL_136911 [Nephila pilipes]